MLERCAAAELVVNATLERYKDHSVVFRTDSNEDFWNIIRRKDDFTSDEGRDQHRAEVQMLKGAFAHRSWIRLEASTSEVNSAPTTPSEHSLFQNLIEQSPGNAVAACSSIQRLLQQKKVKFGDKAIAAIPRADLKTIRAYVELPVVSTDGSTSLVYWSGYGGALNKLQRGREGRWTQVGWMSLWKI